MTDLYYSIEKYATHIESLDLEIEKSRGRSDDEGQSLYFYDFDNHLFELHTGKLEQHLKEYRETAGQKIFHMR